MAEDKSHDAILGHRSNMRGYWRRAGLDYRLYSLAVSHEAVAHNMVYTLNGSTIRFGSAEFTADDALAVIHQAAAAVMAIYVHPQNVVVDFKSDTSPVTNADIVSHRILLSGLARLTPTVAIISEEHDAEHNLTTLNHEAFWLVDPIDGTKEFIKRNGEFTICAALVERGRPVFGIVSAPAWDRVYFGGVNMGSYMIDASGKQRQLHSAGTKQNRLFVSGSEQNDQTRRYIEQQYPGALLQRLGSQLKFTGLAEGLADAYPRIGSTMHSWDVAAGHAILEGAGGTITRPQGDALDYLRTDFMIGDFVARSAYETVRVSSKTV